MLDPNEKETANRPEDRGNRTWKAGMTAYRTLTRAFFGLGGLHWLKKKYQVGLDERMGRFQDVPQEGIWIHAVSVGEVQSASSLVKEIRKDSSLPLLLSTVTTTGRSMAEQRIGEQVDRMIYSPWDSPKFVASALDEAKPRAYIAMETERWPQMLSELARRNIPAFLANGRLSEASFKKLQKTSPFWRGALSCFTKILVRFDEDRERYLALGVPEDRVIVTGDCKVDALMARKSEADPKRWNALRRGDSPLFVAGSTHKGEEEIVIAAFREVRRTHPGARLIIVPRHPERALFVVAAALPYPELQADLFCRLPEDWDIAVVDQVGVLFDLYAACDAAFVGGSLVAKGGQNPLEPALLGIPSCHGEHMTDFPDTARMDALGAARKVRNFRELAGAWNDALVPGHRAEVEKACKAYFETLGGAARRTWEAIRPYIA